MTEFDRIAGRIGGLTVAIGQANISASSADALLTELKNERNLLLELGGISSEEKAPVFAEIEALAEHLQRIAPNTS